MRANAGLLGAVFITIAVFFALFAGMVSAVLPWWFTLVLFSPPLVIAAGSRWPLLAMLITILFVFGVLPLGGQRFVDVIVMSFVFFMIAVYWRKIPEVFARYRRMWVFLGLLMFWTGLMVVYAHFYRRNQMAWIYEEAMSLAYWLVLIPAALIAYNEKTATWALRLLILMSVILSLLSIAQALTGMRLSLSSNARVDAMDAISGGVEGISRSFVPGIVLVMFSFLTALANLLRRTGQTAVWSVVLLITAGALYVSFGRAVWAAMGVGTFLVAILSGRQALKRFALVGLPLMVLAACLIWIVKPDVIAGIITRILSVRTEGAGLSSSLGWRIAENHFARLTILSNPLIGIGPGGEYKPRLIDWRAFSAQTHYIHNGYFFIMLKIGLIGFVFYMLNYLHIMWRCMKEWRLPEVNTSSRIALLTVMLLTMMLNFTQPEFMTGSTVICFAVLAPCILSSRPKLAS